MDLVAAQELAGARVLRSIGPGQRATVLLGHVADEGQGRQVVLKKVAGDDAAERVGRELAALERAAGDHVVRVLDVATAPDCYVLVLERLGGQTLDSLLAKRSCWEAGEAVTLLAPLAAALSRMHAAGVAHGAVAASHIVLTASGSPTLVGFGAAELFPPGSPEAVRAAVPGVARDREGLRALAVGVLDRVVGQHRAGALALARELAVVDGAALLESCGAGLFRLAAARPIESEDAPVPTPSGIRLQQEAEAAAEGREASMRGGAWGLLAGAIPDSWLQWLRELHSGQILEELRGRIREVLAGRRRLVLAGAALTAVAGIALLLAVPPAEDGPDGPPVAGSSPRAFPAAAADAVNAADPVAAAAELLIAREICFRELSALCLERVDQQGSAILERDRAAIRDAQTGAGLDPDALLVDARAPLVLSEELGGSAIVRAGSQADGPSLLLVRGEEGWRIREVIPGEAGR